MNRYHLLMRRAPVIGMAAAVVLGLSIFGIPQAHAVASPGTVTVGGVSPGPTTLTSASVQAEIGDTFILQDNTRGGPNGFWVRNNSGSVSAAGVSCTGAPRCEVAADAAITLTVVAFGTLDIKANGLDIATLTITSGSSGGASPTDLALIYPTATINANGGTCTGPSQFIKAPGQGDWVAAAGMHLIECTRANYTFMGWALSATATTSTFSPGSTVPIGDESFTLYAVWEPTGVEIRYNANVGASDQCVQGGSNVVGEARQSAPVVLPAAGAVASAAPCTPVDAQLVGWALTGDGPSVVAPGAALPASFTPGSSYVLYAKWQVVYGVTASAESLSIAPGELATVTITATLNGAPAANAVVRLAVASTGQFELGSSSDVFTDAAGQAVVTVVSSPNLTAASPPTTLTAAYGNTTASVQLAPSVAVERRIVIAGKRSSLSSITVIRISGKTTGFAAGDRVVPYIRFLGQTDYFEDSTRPEVSADGSFYWRSEFYGRSEARLDLNVYFTSEDGSIRSNALNFLPAR